MAKSRPAPATAPVAAGVPSGPAPTTPPAVADPMLPCPYRQAVMLQQALSPDKMRVGFFLGAGCPLSIRVNRMGKSEPLIPDIVGLTKRVRESMAASAAHKAQFDLILKRIRDDAKSPKTVEDILKHVRGLFEVAEDGDFAGMTKDQIGTLDQAICAEISTVMRERLPTKSTPYHQLAEWINSIERKHPVEVFTSNYDLLMEQAFEECNVPYFDGFSGSDRTFFDVASMEQDRRQPPWARLWKVHGSINWWRTKDGSIQRREKGDADACQMIHPSHLKYDESRKLPYLAMQDRLRSFLARGQAVLVTCGYSFLDGHINQAILDGLGGNPSAVCYGLVYGDRVQAATAVEKTRKRGNLRLLGADGGVLGTISQDWHAKTDREHQMHNLAVCDGSLNDRSAAPDNRCKFLLGDFKSLGRFLADQLARRGQDEEGDHAA